MPQRVDRMSLPLFGRRWCLCLCLFCLWPPSPILLPLIPPPLGCSWSRITKPPFDHTKQTNTPHHTSEQPRGRHEAAMGMGMGMMMMMMVMLAPLIRFLIRRETPKEPDTNSHSNINNNNNSKERLRTIATTTTLLLQQRLLHKPRQPTTPQTGKPRTSNQHQHNHVHFRPRVAVLIIRWKLIPIVALLDRFPFLPWPLSPPLIVICFPVRPRPHLLVCLI